MHATLVAAGADGVLLRGPSGSGKSDLALRLLAAPRSWRLVADDQVLVSRIGERVVGTAPTTLAGQLEVRGVGIVAVAHATSADIRLIIDLVPRDQVPRLPEPAIGDLLGLPIPCFRLHAFEVSAPDKVGLLLQQVVASEIDKN